MQNAETTGARDFRRDLTRHLTAAEHGGRPTLVTRNGRPAALLVKYAHLASIAAELRHAHRHGHGNVIDRQIEALETMTTPEDA